MTVTDERIAFQTLIYTDCVPGQGLRGTAGLQFQARSAGAGQDAMTLVQRGLLYEPPDAWMRQRRPVSDYPISFAHDHDGVYATACGVYLGREANGGREGNQLTHSIVTHDPSSYGLVRPAQLCQAPFWVTSPAPTTSCEPVGEGWEPGPFTADAAQAFVREQPDGERWLRALLSALDRVGGQDSRRVLFIARDPVQVLHWIAAATLLVPQAKALTIGIKVFSTDPAYAPQPVVAVHPDWGSTNVGVGNDSGYAVFDLESRQCSDVPPTDLAHERVRLLLEHDPHDVVDLIEVMALVERPPAIAFELGRAMVMPGGPLTVELARHAVGWLRETGPQVLAPYYRGMLVDALTRDIERWPADILVGLDQIAVRGQVPADRVGEVRLALIRGEVDRARRESGALPVQLDPLPPDVWTAAFRDQAEELVAAALRRAPRVSAFDSVLRIAKRLQVQPRLSGTGEAVAGFVRDWADHPGRDYDLGAWNCAGELDGLLREELSRRIAAGRGDEVGDAWWTTLVDSVEKISTELDRTIIAAAMRSGSQQQRAALVRDFVTGALRTGRETAVQSVAQCLWGRTRPEYGELAQLCELLTAGPQLDNRHFERLRQRLNGGESLTT